MSAINSASLTLIVPKSYLIVKYLGLNEENKRNTPKKDFKIYYCFAGIGNSLVRITFSIRIHGHVRLFA
jgi:hypothetical protein